MNPLSPNATKLFNSPDFKESAALNAGCKITPSVAANLGMTFKELQEAAVELTNAGEAEWFTLTTIKKVVSDV
jgi:hypothetical protein